MSKTTKFKLEIISVYTALVVTFLCLIVIQTILIKASINGTQNQQYQTQQTSVRGEQIKPTKTASFQTNQ
jgi:hypothetical protein